MKSIKFTAYRDLVINDILNYNIIQLQDRYSHDIKFLYSVLNDLSKGPVSPNYKFIKRIASIGNIHVDALINRATVLIDDIGIENTKNYYEILSVEKEASAELIRDSWLSQLKDNHPDLIGEQGIEKTKELNEAYEILKDVNKRREYDSNFFDYYPVKIESEKFPLLYSRKSLMAFSIILIIMLSFLVKGYFEGFIEDNNHNKVVHRQLEYFEEVNKERSEENYNKDVDSLYSEFNKEKKIAKKDKSEKKDENKDNPKILNKENSTVSNSETSTESEEGKDTDDNIKADNSIADKKDISENTKNSTENNALLNSLIEKYGSKRKKKKEKISSAATKPVISKKTVKEEKIVKVEKTDTDKKVAVVKQKSAEVPDAVPATFSDKNNEPTSTSVYYFVSDYVSAYKNRDYDKMKLLFLPTASENNMDLNKTLDMYKNNFEKNKILRYDIQIKNKSIRGSNALVDGNFIVIFNTEENKEVKTREGSIRWKLKWIDEKWKIDSLNYSFNKDKEFM